MNAYFKEIIEMLDFSEGAQLPEPETIYPNGEMLDFFKENHIDEIQYGKWLDCFSFDYRDFEQDLKCVIEFYGSDEGFEWPEPDEVYE